MATKKKVSQEELRRLMNDQKKKLLSAGIKKIESPLAKYDKNGQLTCIVCDHVVRSEAVWNVHINSKNHRENISKKAKRKESPVQVQEPPTKMSMAPPATPPVLKSILKNSHEITKVPLVPPDFSNHNSKKPQKSSVIIEKATTLVGGPSTSSEVESMEEDLPAAEKANGTELPEGFFDDPKQDAKVRNVEYKDPIEEEWEQFQKEIKEETSKAQVIISEDQEEATNERQIDEIDEQMRHWTRVMSLEKMKKESIPAVVAVKVENDDEDMDDDTFDEFVDWRSKASFL